LDDLDSSEEGGGFEDLAVGGLLVGQGGWGIWDVRIRGLEDVRIRGLADLFV